MNKLPDLKIKQLGPTRDYLQDTALILSSLQRTFLPRDPHLWQYGLEVSMRGVVSQPFKIKGQETEASLDLVKYKFRLDGSKWLFSEYSPPEIFNNVKAWVASKGSDGVIEEPRFTPGHKQPDTKQVNKYAASLWWMNGQFLKLKEELKGGLLSPILLYPHHFDLSLTWFPFNDERQLSIGFSSGDENILEPYVYLSAYPEPKGYSRLKLAAQAYFNKKGFSGAVLPYQALSSSDQPEQLLSDFSSIFNPAKQLFL